MKSFPMMLTVAISILFVSCGGSSTSTSNYSVGGTVSGLTGTGLVLQDINTDNLSVTTNGNFTFATALPAGAAFSVTVLTQPSNPAQTCAVTYGASGTVNGTITYVQITCTNTTFSLGGTVSGLSGTGLVLQDNGGSNLSVSANGSFAFSAPVSRGSSYNVTVLTQPSSPAQTCGVTNGYGADVLGNVADIQVLCITTTVTYTIGGTVTGLSGSGLVLQNNSSNTLSIATNGSFTFTTPVASGSNYSVTVLSQPSSPAQNCVVTGGSGVANANNTSVLVTCTTITYSIGGTISGLTGTGLVLQDNGGSNLPISAGAASFTFSAQVPSGSTYAVTVLTQPSDPNCTVANGSGTVTSASVTNITIVCSSTSYNIAITVSGLPPNTSAGLQDNGSDNLSVSASGVATNFNTPVASGAAYAVTVTKQPAGATCAVGANGSGTVASSNVSVAVTCTDPVAAGDVHTCVRTSSGGVFCWGANQFGQLGNATTTGSAIPVRVSGLSSGVAAITAGSEHSCALTNAGGVWCWGYNAAGQLGNGTFTQSNIPVQVLDSTGAVPLEGVVAISAGQSHTCALTDTGAMLCWGDNADGELGNGTYNGSAIPVPVSGLSSSVAAISAGSRFTCAATATGVALCWGNGDSGQLGNGNATDSNTPSAVLNATGKAPISGVAAISAGAEHTCALTGGGAVFCWGNNSANQLGSGTVSSLSYSPLEVLGPVGNAPLGGVVAISASRSHTCAVTNSGVTLCWGDNTEGELGNGDSSDSSTGAQVLGISSSATAIAAGYQHTCAVISDGAVRCWGDNANGQLGNGSTISSSIPVPASDVGKSGFLHVF